MKAENGGAPARGLRPTFLAATAAWVCMAAAFSGCNVFGEYNNVFDPKSPVYNYYLMTPGPDLSNGTMTPSKATYVKPGAEIAIAATPKAGYVFSGWKSDISYSSYTSNAVFADATSASTTVTLTANATITPQFADANGSFTLTPGTLSHGKMAPAATKVKAGAVTAIEATPDSGYAFGSWSASPVDYAIFGSATSASTTVLLLTRQYNVLYCSI